MALAYRGLFALFSFAGFLGVDAVLGTVPSTHPFDLESVLLRV